jgi:hypothetical protein
MTGTDSLTGSDQTRGNDVGVTAGRFSVIHVSIRSHQS